MMMTMIDEGAFTRTGPREGVGEQTEREMSGEEGS